MSSASLQLGVLAAARSGARNYTERVVRVDYVGFRLSLRPASQ
jgi:hypothetical protein